MKHARTVAERYAEALAELAVEADALDAVDADLGAVAELVAGDAELSATLTLPGQGASARRRMAQEIAKALELGDLATNFLQVLAGAGRMGALPDVADEFHHIVNDRKGVVVADVTSATELSEEETERIRRALSKKFGMDVAIRTSVDDRLVGGVRATVGNRLLDASVAGALERLRTVGAKAG
jgi:F-type H+-transporting ATPase subunit delta